MTSVVRGVNAMRGVTGRKVQRLDSDHIIVSLIIKDCTTKHLASSDNFSFKIPVNDVTIATRDVNLCSRLQTRVFPQFNEHSQRFLQGVLANTYADFRLEVAWDDVDDSHEVLKCLITVPHEWYEAYCSPEHNKW